MVDSELISALIAHFPTFIQKSCVTVRRDCIQDAVGFLQQLEATEGNEGFGNRAVTMQMRLDRLSSTRTSDGRTITTMLDKPLCRVLKISQNQWSWRNSRNYNR
jgi:hypothetical protein